MRIDWSPLAKADRNAIFDYIEEQNLVAAIAVDEQIEIQTDRLLDFPESGRLGRIPNTRELIITHTPYIAAYTIREDVVLVLRVLHGSQLWPDELPDE